MVITSRQNPLVRLFRDGGGGDAFAVEGAKLISQALDAGFKPLNALFTAKAAERWGVLAGRLDFSVISEDLSGYVSDTKTPQGAFALFARKNDAFDFTGARRLVLLDGVRDPGNAGAVARSCEAFGFDGVIFSADSADVYNGKLIRSSAGSVFRLPNYRGDLPEIIPSIKKAGFRVYAATASGDGADEVGGSAFAEKSAVVIGSEGQGVSEKVAALSDRKIYIPVKGVESLNAAVAAGIICYVCGRR
ncbi:MAG: RNA methyltransferase [Oscillospiraceae bacterium]|jgi:TrmH family RNA methyltransferase|nr:RNA methyltransferase [Oscillospiraceae bacterium]